MCNPTVLNNLLLCLCEGSNPLGPPVASAHQSGAAISPHGPCLDRVLWCAFEFPIFEILDSTTSPHAVPGHITHRRGLEPRTLHLLADHSCQSLKLLQHVPGAETQNRRFHRQIFLLILA